MQLLKAQLAFLRRLVFSTKKIDAPMDTFVGSQDFEYRGDEVTILMRQHGHRWDLEVFAELKMSFGVWWSGKSTNKIYFTFYYVVE